MLQLVGTVLTTSFVHQTDPNKDGNKNKTLKTWMWDANHQRREIPFVTANSIRGQLRRAAAEIALDAINAPVSRALFSVLTSGKASRKDIGEVPTTAALVKGAVDPFAGLFGGGGYMLPSRYSVGPLLPEIEWCQRALHPSLRDRMIPADRLTYTDADGRLHALPLITEVILTSRDDVMAGKGQDRIANYQQSLEAWLSEVATGNAAKAKGKAAEKKAREAGEKYQDDGGAKSSDNRMVSLFEAILPGTPLQFWLRFNSKATDAQVGLMLLAVRDWANANVIGGASARGFGRFEAEIALYDDDREILPNIFNPEGGATAYTLSKALDSYLSATEAALKSMTKTDLEEVYGTQGMGI